MKTVAFFAESTLVEGKEQGCWNLEPHIAWTANTDQLCKLFSLSFILLSLSGSQFPHIQKRSESRADTEVERSARSRYVEVCRAAALLQRSPQCPEHS